MAFTELDAESSGRMLVDTEWREKDLIKLVPGARWDPHQRIWAVPRSWGACQALRGVFGQGLQIGPQLRTWSWGEFRGRVQPALELRNALELALPLDSTDNDHDDRLRPFQLAGREFIVQGIDVLLGDDMGTGKTVQAVSALRRVDLLAGDAYPALIVCPNSIKRSTWERHVREWLPEATPYVLEGGPAKRRKTLKEATDDPLAVVIVNIEGVRLLSRLAPYGSVKLKRCVECDKRHGDPDVNERTCHVHPKELNGFGFRTCVLDEAHRVKDPKAQQTRAIWATFHDPSVRRRWAMTGTPISNHPGDLWPVLHTIAPYEWPVKTPFIDRYALSSWNAFGGLDVVGLNPETRDEFFRIFEPRFRRVTKRVVLPHLPPKVRTTRYVEMTPKQRKAYEDIEDRLVTKLDDDTVLIAKKAISAQVRLLQFATAYCTVDDSADPEDPKKWVVSLVEPSPKVDELIDVLGDLGVPGSDRSIAVAAEHRQIIELASARLTKLEVPHVLVTGAVPDAERANNVAAFQRGDVPVIMFTFKAGGVGLDMTRADTLVRLQRSWSMVDNLQGEDRIHRIGSEGHASINLIDVVTANTVEIDQIRTFGRKLERLEEITRDRQRHRELGLPTDDLDEEEARIMGSYLGKDVEEVTSG